MKESEITDPTIESLRTLGEMELREFKCPWPTTMKDLDRVINALVDRQHEYGTCPYAMSIAAEAAYHFVAGALGVTGFQASFADLDFIRRVRGLKSGFRILNYDDLLYPQYHTPEHFPSLHDLMADAEIRGILKERAEKELATAGENAHPDVVRHWKRLAEWSVMQ
jgi:hypothetical protein